MPCDVRHSREDIPWAVATLARLPRHGADSRDVVESSHPGSADSLADRMAATIGPREPGWRLPRRGALARKHGASLGELDAAIGDLVRRARLRRLPDGQLYRASTGEAWLPVEGATGLATRLDPMGNAIERQSREISRRTAPPEVTSALGLPAGVLVGAVRTVWSLDGEPAADATAYRADASCDDDFPPFADATAPLAAATVRARVGPADPAIAPALGLGPGSPAITVTARFAEAATREPVAIAIVTFRAELFRIGIEISCLTGFSPGAVRVPTRPGLRVLRGRGWLWQPAAYHRLVVTTSRPEPARLRCRSFWRGPWC